MTTNRLFFPFGARKISSGSESPPIKKSRCEIFRVFREFLECGIVDFLNFSEFSENSSISDFFWSLQFSCTCEFYNSKSNFDINWVISQNFGIFGISWFFRVLWFAKTFFIEFRCNSNRRPLSELSPSAIIPPKDFSASNRRPLGELSPNAISKPMQIPKIAIQYDYDENDDVFDEEDKENFPGSGRKVLFPSFGTSPGHALKLSSTLDEFSPSEIEDQTKKKLGQGSFGTVVLGVLHGNWYS